LESVFSLELCFSDFSRIDDRDAVRLCWEQGANVTVSGCHTKVGQLRQTLKGDCDAMGRCITLSSVILVVSGAPRCTRQKAGAGCKCDCEWMFWPSRVSPRAAQTVVHIVRFPQHGRDKVQRPEQHSVVSGGEIVFPIIIWL
jgi:hypothetical protein